MCGRSVTSIAERKTNRGYAPLRAQPELRSYANGKAKPYRTGEKAAHRSELLIKLIEGIANHGNCNRLTGCAGRKSYPARSGLKINVSSRRPALPSRCWLRCALEPTQLAVHFPRILVSASKCFRASVASGLFG